MAVLQERQDQGSARKPQRHHPSAADAPEDNVNNKTFHKCTPTHPPTPPIKQTDGGIEVLGDLLEQPLHTGYIESLQPELYETLRQHQSHEPPPSCTGCHGTLMHIRQPCSKDN